MSTAGSAYTNNRPKDKERTILRRITIVGTALAVFAVATGVAYATTFNTYNASFRFANKVGSSKKPAPLGYAETYGANGLNGNRAAPLVDIKSSVYGLVSTTKNLPTCSPSRITANPAKWDKACPPRSMIAGGPVTSLLGPGSNLKAAGSPCDPFLHIYNGGHGKVVFFFVTIPGHACGGLKTGAAAPWVGTVKQVGKNLVLDSPLPPDVSTKAGGLAGVYGSLVTETLTWKSDAQASVACKAGKRPWSVTFTAVNQGVRETPQTVKGSGKC